MGKSRRLTFVVLALKCLPLVALTVLVRYAFTWKVPVSFVLYIGFLTYRGWRSGYRPQPLGNGRALAELFASALLGAIVGSLLFGGLGGIFGFALGFVTRLGEIPIRARHG
jgi:hypothetical protein